MKQILLVMSVIGLSGCAAQQSHRQTPNRELAAFKEPAWFVTSTQGTASPRPYSGPAAFLEVARLKVGSAETRAAVERLGLTSEPAILTDEQFAELVEAAPAGEGCLARMPRIWMPNDGMTSVQIGWQTGDKVEGTALYLVASDLTAEGACVQFALQCIYEDENWSTEGAEKLKVGQAAAQLVATDASGVRTYAVAVHLASVGEVVCDMPLEGFVD